MVGSDERDALHPVFEMKPVRALRWTGTYEETR